MIQEKNEKQNAKHEESRNKINFSITPLALSLTI